MEMEKVSNIKYPVLNMGGDGDQCIDPIGMIQTHKLIPAAEQRITPEIYC